MTNIVFTKSMLNESVKPGFIMVLKENGNVVSQMVVTEVVAKKRIKIVPLLDEHKNELKERNGFYMLPDIQTESYKELEKYTVTDGIDEDGKQMPEEYYKPTIYSLRKNGTWIETGKTMKYPVFAEILMISENKELKKSETKVEPVEKKVETKETKVEKEPEKELDPQMAKNKAVNEIINKDDKGPIFYCDGKIYSKSALKERWDNGGFDLENLKFNW